MFRMIAVVLLTIPLSGCWLLFLDSGSSGGYSTDDRYESTGDISFDATGTSPFETLPAHDGTEPLKLSDHLVQTDDARLAESATRVPYAPSASSANMAP